AGTRDSFEKSTRTLCSGCAESDSVDCARAITNPTQTAMHPSAANLDNSLERFNSLTTELMASLNHAVILADRDTRWQRAHNSRPNQQRFGWKPPPSAALTGVID